VLVRRPNDDPAWAGVEQVVGDLIDPTAVRRVLAGVSAAFYVPPHEEGEEDLARIFVTECNRAGARIVFAGVHISSRTARDWLILQAMRVLLPNYRPKLRIGQMIERAAPHAVLFSASNFYDNDELFLDDILAGRYPMPMRGVNRVAVSDVGELCGRALLDPDFPSGTYSVSGRRSFTGSESAQVWAEVLGWPVAYTGDDVGAWHEALDRRVPPGKKNRDFRASFRTLGRIAVKTSAADVAETTKLLGRPPRAYADHVRELARTPDVISRPDHAG
jgi:uncharacterized protein YbjT (DUF2867 family)